MKIVRLRTALRRLRPINEEIRYRECASGTGFTAGVIAFARAKRSGAKQIRHADRDVLCHVLRGRGRLCVNGKRIALAPGVVCHIPKGTPHDFAATRNELVLFYALITTRARRGAGRARQS